MRYFFFLQVIFLATAAGAQTYQLFENTLKGSRGKTMILVHGGAWTAGSGSAHIDVAQALIQKGYCLALAEYGVAPAFKYPVQTEQLNTVINSLSRQKSKTCNLKKIYLAGYSAGAQIIADWAVRYDNPAVRGFLGYAGTYDIPLLVKGRPEFEDSFITKEFGIPKNWETASPARQKLLSKKPWLLVHSKTDELINYEQHLAFKANLKKQNIKFEVLELETGLHGQSIIDVRDENSPITKKTLEFIKKN